MDDGIVNRPNPNWGSALTHIYIYVYVYIYTVIAKNIGTLGKYDQSRLWKCICIINPFDLLNKSNHKKYNLSLDNKNLFLSDMSPHFKCFSLIHIGHN